MTLQSLLLLLALAVTSAPSFSATQSGRVVFIRGAAGTGGFLEGGSDEQLSDINNFGTFGGNHGYGQLADVLRADGYTVEQVIESETGAPVDFAALDLSTVRVLVLGSNNQTYSSSDVQAVTSFVTGGGGLLVISDANWGSNWGMAPSSDQHFLDPYGLVMNQDTATYVSRASEGDHLVPISPVLSGPNLGFDTTDDVQAFDGEGVSPLTVGPTPPNVAVQILARAEDRVHVNDSPSSGSFRPVGPDDACLVVAYSGLGAVVGHFDRNTFFNSGGAGTNITRFDNTQYARNIFRFLSGPVPQPYGEPKINSQGGAAWLVVTQTETEVTLSGYGALPAVPTYYAVGSQRASLPFFGGELLVGGSTFRFGLGLTDGDGASRNSLPLMPSAVSFKLNFQQLYRDIGDPTGFGLSSAVETLHLR